MFAYMSVCTYMSVVPYMYLCMCVLFLQMATSPPLWSGLAGLGSCFLLLHLDTCTHSLSLTYDLGRNGAGWDNLIWSKH